MMETAAMRAIVTRLRPDGSREKALVEDWPDPGPPGRGRFRTQTVCSGVTNGTERNDLTRGNYANPDEALPAGWGYQNVGRVTEVGADVPTVRAGELLYLSADHMEYIVTAEDGLYLKLPHGADPEEAALFGMASVAMRTCRNAELAVGERVLIVGAGCIGQFAAQIAAAMGARPALCDIDAARLDVARRIGAAEAIVDVSSDGWENSIQNGEYDAVVDLAGVPGMEDELLSAARERGRVLFIAGRDKVTYTLNLGQWHELTIKQNSHFEREDLESLCCLVERGLVRIAPLIRDVVPVTEAKRIYDTLRDEPGNLLGTVFVW
jgi:2-desacetyl-2-hydroxyethyl bacteriochlorophyllide A dehydrogenase